MTLTNHGIYFDETENEMIEDLIDEQAADADSQADRQAGIAFCNSRGYEV